MTPFRNPRLISWDSWDVFCPPNVGLCELVSQKQKYSTLGGKEHDVLSLYHGFCTGCPNVM